MDAAGSAARSAAYALLIIVAVSLVGQGVLTAPPSFTANDQSRWATIRALVDEGTYAIGERVSHRDGSYEDRGIVTEIDWRTIDVIMYPETQRFYSSKPPLLPTVLAGEYWLLRRVFDWKITRDRLPVSRTILLTINWFPFLIYLILFARLIERLGTTDWGRLFVLASACFGTFVSGFSGSLNNHTVAAAGALFAVYHCVRLQLDRDRQWWRFVLAGLFLGWTACSELPAAALAAGGMLWLAHVSWRDALRFSLPALLLPIATHLYVRYEVFGTVLPTYLQKSWYLFPGSYWRHPVGIDRAADGELLYAFNLLVGHHGILLLSPVLLLGWIGMFRTAILASREDRPLTPQTVLSALTLVLTTSVFVFYVFRTNDYGGVSAGPRWFIWLVPLWLLTMIPEADRWSTRRSSRAIAYVLLVLSVGSALYALSDPWRHPWLFNELERLKWISYP